VQVNKSFDTPAQVRGFLVQFAKVYPGAPHKFRAFGVKGQVGIVPIGFKGMR
jgi:hypothetical protein